MTDFCDSPRTIEMTASEEMVAIDNLDILKLNGFDIQVDYEAPPTQRIKIISQPVSKNTMFNTKGRHNCIFRLSKSRITTDKVHCQTLKSLYFYCPIDQAKWCAVVRREPCLLLGRVEGRS